MRIGQGYDAHRFSANRDLVLGGVTVPHEKGLLGHSDADVLTHAVCDALLGAAGLGDLGTHFPDSDDDDRPFHAGERSRSAPEGTTVGRPGVGVVAGWHKGVDKWVRMGQSGASWRTGRGSTGSRKRVRWGVPAHGG